MQSTNQGCHSARKQQAPPVKGEGTAATAPAQAEWGFARQMQTKGRGEKSPRSGQTLGGPKVRRAVSALQGNDSDVVQGFIRIGRGSWAKVYELGRMNPAVVYLVLARGAQ